MSTFINPAKVRELAATGDQFYKGAAWILDQQDAARIDARDAVHASLDALVSPREVRNAADLGAPRVG